MLYVVILQGADLLDSQTGRKALVVDTDRNDSGRFATIADVERAIADERSHSLHDRAGHHECFGAVPGVTVQVLDQG